MISICNQIFLIHVANEEEVDPIEDKIHHFGDLDSEIYLTEEEHNMFA